MNPTKKNPLSSAYVQGDLVATKWSSPHIHLSVGCTMIHAECVAQERINTTAYTVAVTRALGPSSPKLSQLSIGSGILLTPSFDPMITHYNGVMPAGFDSVNITYYAPGLFVSVNGIRGYENNTVVLDFPDSRKMEVEILVSSSSRRAGGDPTSYVLQIVAPIKSSVHGNFVGDDALHPTSQSSSLLLIIMCVSAITLCCCLLAALLCCGFRSKLFPRHGSETEMKTFTPTTNLNPVKDDNKDDMHKNPLYSPSSSDSNGSPELAGRSRAESESGLRNRSASGCSSNSDFCLTIPDAKLEPTELSMYGSTR